MRLSDEELERYARHIVLPQVGGLGQRRLKEASVAVVGAGGIGSAVIPALAGAGIGRLTIIDSDVVDLSNLHRQPLFRERDAGYSKADLALQFVQRLNRHVKATPVQARIDTNNAQPATCAQRRQKRCHDCCCAEAIAWPAPTQVMNKVTMQARCTVQNGSM